MGRIFISAAHGGQESGVTDPGAVIAGTTEAERDDFDTRSRGDRTAIAQL
jgi:hypothetical protein